jgi:hypothetical protein
MTHYPLETWDDLLSWQARQPKLESNPAAALVAVWQGDARLRSKTSI